MSKAAFPINDLRRRKLQTSLIILTLTLSVASTLFLLLFSSRLGFGIASATGTLTQGLTAIFSQFILFIGVLIFAVGAVLTSFIAFLMMAQRTRDFGLIKAAGCPNSLVAGYFMTELLTTTFAGCILGIALGFFIDYAAANVVFSAYQLPNFWFAPLVFVAFFVLSVVFGLQPILKAARMSPVKALSPVNYYGLTTTNKHKPLSRSGITWRIASRSLFRRQSASVRIIILLSIVFILLTVSVAGGIIASDTTTSWIQKTVNSDTIAIAHNSMGNQYKLLLSKFSGAKETGDFNYSDPKLAIPATVIDQLSALPSVSLVDSRLILKEHVGEVANFTVFPDTEQTVNVGDSRQGDAIVIGVNPQKLAGSWFVQGRFLSENDDNAAVIGDSVAQSMYSSDTSKNIILSDPLVEGIEFQNSTFGIVGVCVDPVNNGLVTYVPIERLMNTTGVSNPNLLLVKLNNATDRSAALAQIKTSIQSIDPDLNVFDLNDVVAKDANFLASTWQTIMLLPLFTLVSAALCLVGYMMLAVDEQHQEFAVLRAVGAKPKIVIFILAIQSIIVLVSSFAVGISLGTIITLLILMKQPLVTSVTILEITGWLLAALAGMFIFSLYPAFRLAKASILKIMT
ncbi:MAG: FtsX-like permease family protein [Candidatus Bathyarchaeota archaeon]|nr:FtsX-like permease family protein [Candidatus Bathyarchaeota archaeon]